MRRLLMIVYFLFGAWLCAWQVTGQVPGTGVQTVTGKKPAILIIDYERGHRDYWNPLTLQEMLDAGYEVGMCPREKIPTAEELKRYNVVLVVNTVGVNFATDIQPKLEKFMEQGGGVLVIPNGIAPNPIDGKFCLPDLLKWLREFGATIYLQGVVDPERRAVVDWCKWPGAPEYIWTSEFADSPVTHGVKTLWHRTLLSQHGGSGLGLLMSAPMELDANWTPLVFTGPGSRTVSWAESPNERDRLLTPPARKAFEGFIEPTVRSQGRMPLLATRNCGAGRLAVFSVNPQDLFWSGYIPAMGGVMLHRGFKDRPSDGWKLLDNLYRWLAEPSLSGTALGGAKTVRMQLFREPLTTQKPYDWKTGADTGLGGALIVSADPLRADALSTAEKLAAGTGRKVPQGLVGAHSAYSSGKGSVAEWVTAAKAAGLDFLIFMEDMSLMNAEKWEKLKAECAALSDDQFLAYPGLEFQHEIFNRGYLFNRKWKWEVEEKILTKDHRFIRTGGLEHVSRGPVWLWLAYEQPENLCTIMTLGFFSHQTNLTPTWAQRGFGSMSVFTRNQDQIMDDFADTLPLFLRQQNQKLVISPMALSLMSAPSEIAGAVKRGGPFVTLLSDRKNAASALDTGGTYSYGGRSSAICATTGPRILAWNPSYTTAYVFPRWSVARREEDFFVLDNYRYRVRLAVEAAAGLQEILIYDGDQGVYRRFLPDGKKQYEAVLDLSNDQVRHLVLVVKDQAGGIAVSPEIQTENWANRHYLCGDRCNYGTGNAGQGAYYVHPGPYTTQQGPETMLVARRSRPVISADVLALRANLDTRFETAGAYQYHFGNPWTCYYRTWPAEEMAITKTDYLWTGTFGGPIYNTEEFAPAVLDSIWEFPRPEQPFYPENRWIPDPWTVGLADWKRTGHYTSEVVLTADVTLREPWVSALRTSDGTNLPVRDMTLPISVDYVPGQGAYDFRIGDQRLSGVLPGKGAPPLELNADAPEGGLFALTMETGKTGVCWLVTGKGLHYKLSAANGKATLDVGWPVADAKAKKGTVWRCEVYALSGPTTETALNELQQPTGLKASTGTPVDKRFPYTYNAVSGAVVLKADDLRAIPCEWIPLELRGLHTRRTAYWHELGTYRVRPIGVDPDGVGRAVLWRNKHDTSFFIGHPVLCSDPEIWFDAVRMADGTWILDVNNPTDRDRTGTFSWHPAWPGRGKLPDPITLTPGGRQQFTIKEGK